MAWWVAARAETEAEDEETFCCETFCCEEAETFCETFCCWLGGSAEEGRPPATTDPVWEATGGLLLPPSECWCCLGLPWW